MTKKRLLAHSLVLLLISLAGTSCGQTVADDAQQQSPINIEDTTETPDQPLETEAPITEDSPTPGPTERPTTIPTPMDVGLARLTAEAGVSGNEEWTPYAEEINGVEMALVPAGCFMMGSSKGPSNEKPIHEVCFDEPFWIDKYEVTNAQFNALNGEARRESFWMEAQRPRERITWVESLAFCELRGARLPTEAEWEYAARGPDNLVYPWGDEFVADNVVFFENSDFHAWNVGSKPGGASWAGAFDLNGNLAEWVNDWYAQDLYETLTDTVVNPQGPESGELRVFRGGSWGESDAQMHAANRISKVPDYQESRVGFRCALSYSP